MLSENDCHQCAYDAANGIICCSLCSRPSSLQGL